MNLIRLIKLKKLNGELNYLTDLQHSIIELFDELIVHENVYISKSNKLVRLFVYFPLKNVLYVSQVNIVKHITSKDEFVSIDRIKIAFSDLMCELNLQDMEIVWLNSQDR